jgi:hypothetical protein
VVMAMTAMMMGSKMILLLTMIKTHNDAAV